MRLMRLHLMKISTLYYCHCVHRLHNNVCVRNLLKRTALLGNAFNTEELCGTVVISKSETDFTSVKTETVAN